MATETIVALADCWANNLPNNIDSNLNAQGLGMGMWAGGLNRSFLKFSLQGISSDLNKLINAELRLYGSRIHSTAKVRAYFTANVFNEITLTWRNQPPPTILGGSGSLMGETSDVPDAASWYTVPVDPVFVKARIGNQYFLVILQGTEEPESYCWASDREEAGGAYAPKLVLTTGEVTYATAITLNSPASVQVGSPFSVTGVLTYTDSLGNVYPLAGRTVSVAVVDGIIVAAQNVVTDANGAYGITVTVGQPGIFNVQAAYAGE